MPKSSILHDVEFEKSRQLTNAAYERGAELGCDRTNSKNDWIAYASAHLGRAAEKVVKNEREGQEFRDNMVKAAAVCVAAIESFDKGYC